MTKKYSLSSLLTENEKVSDRMSTKTNAWKRILVRLTTKEEWAKHWKVQKYSKMEKANLSEKVSLTSVLFLPATRSGILKGCGSCAARQNISLVKIKIRTESLPKEISSQITQLYFFVRQAYHLLVDALHRIGHGFFLQSFELQMDVIIASREDYKCSVICLAKTLFQTRYRNGRRSTSY